MISITGRVLMSDRLYGAMAVHAKHDETRSTGGISAFRSSHRADDYSVPSSGDRQQRYQQQQQRHVPEIQIHEPPAVNPDPAAELNIEPGIEPAIPQHRPQRQCNMPQRYGNNKYDV